jgi:hypothetical protein
MTRDDNALVRAPSDRSSEPKIKKEDALLGEPALVSTDAPKVRIGAAPLQEASLIRKESDAKDDGQAVLRGTLRSGAFEGRWGFGRDAVETSAFKYEARTPSEEGGWYDGGFDIKQSTGNLRVDEAFSLSIADVVDGRRAIKCVGDNCFGHFEMSGSCASDGSDCLLVRIYAETETEPVCEALVTAGTPRRKKRSKKPREKGPEARRSTDVCVPRDETPGAPPPDYWPELPCDRACCAKSKRLAAGQFVAKFRKTQDRERLQKHVNYLKRDLLKWQAQQVITEDRCKELEKKIAAKRLALRQR